MENFFFSPKGLFSKVIIYVWRTIFLPLKKKKKWRDELPSISSYRHSKFDFWQTNAWKRNWTESDLLPLLKTTTVNNMQQKTFDILHQWTHEISFSFSQLSSIFCTLISEMETKCLKRNWTESDFYLYHHCEQYALCWSVRNRIRKTFDTLHQLN